MPSQSGHRAMKMSRSTVPAVLTLDCIVPYIVAQGIPRAVNIAVVVEVIILMFTLFDL